MTPGVTSRLDGRLVTETQTVDRCQATLKHAHGLSQCELPNGHSREQKHAAYCEDCYDDDVRLYWTQQHEKWPI